MKEYYQLINIHHSAGGPSLALGPRTVGPLVGRPSTVLASQFGVGGIRCDQPVTSW
jgi:hypothetical protein